MKKTVLFTGLILMVVGALGQKTKEFFDKDNTPTDSAASFYYVIVSKKIKEVHSFGMPGTAKSVLVLNDTVLTFYTSSGTHKSRAIFKDNVLEGPFTSWHENGKVKEKGFYKSGVQVLSSLTNYPNGRGQAVYQFVLDNGLVRRRLINYYDSAGVAIVSNGNGCCKCYVEYGGEIFLDEGKVVNGKRDSVWTRKYLNGKLKDTTVYRNGELPDNSIHSFVEQQPNFPGGLEAMTRFIQLNLKYPNSARRANQEGKVFVQFVVERDGTISNVEALKGISRDIDDEAVRVVRLMPNWTPGRENGELVRVKYVVPLNFRLGR